MTLQEINGFSVGSHRTNRYNSLSPPRLAFQLSGCTWVSITARYLPAFAVRLYLQATVEIQLFAATRNTSASDKRDSG